MQNRQLLFTVLGSKTACFLLTFSLSLGLGGNLAKAASPDNTNISIPLHTLTVIKIGDGTVTSDDHGIDCGEDCSETYSLNTSVTLTATTPSFTGWSGGDCTGKGDCIVNMDADKTITAKFRDKFSWPLFSPKTKK